MNTNEVVILLHGMGRSRLSMVLLAIRIRRQGFRTVNIDYPSTRKSIEALSEEYLAPAIAACKEQGAAKIHIVTHSLGGIIARQYLQNQSLPEGSRIVMLSPPNKGSEVTDALRNSLLYKLATGPAGQSLGTEAASLPNRLQRVQVEIGIITGSRSSDPWFSRLFPGEHDGKVSVERARLEEMVDFLVVSKGHTLIMNSRYVMQQVVYFLRNGSFEKS